MSQFISAVDSVSLVEHAGVPRKALKALLVGNGLCPGSRVLVVGGANVEFLRCLDGLGLLVTGFESNGNSLAALRGGQPPIDWRGGHPGETAYLPEQAFDLVLVRDHPSYHGSLSSSDALRTTSDLLASLRPCGFLAFVDPTHSVPVPGARLHSAGCVASLLQTFPGTPRAEFFAEGPVRRLWTRGHAPTPSSNYWVVQHQLGTDPIPRLAWRRLAELATEFPKGDCCEKQTAGRDQRRAA
jgi:SAM-dependent methyltransferase